MHSLPESHQQRHSLVTFYIISLHLPLLLPVGILSTGITCINCHCSGLKFGTLNYLIWLSVHLLYTADKI